MASIVKRLLFAAFLLVPAFSDAQTLWPDVTPKAFLQMIDRPRAALAPAQNNQREVNGIEHWHFTYAADEAQRVTGLLTKATNVSGKRPVVVALHGTGGSKEDLLELLQFLAQRGFIGVAIDGRYHGERSNGGDGYFAYTDAILRTYRTGKEHPFLYDTVWDVLRLLDYLETRDDVDPQRIGLIGFSKGGMETYLAAAVDHRIAVAVPMIGVQSFRWALDNNAWQSRVGTIQPAIDQAARDEGKSEINTDFVRHFYDRVVPGIADRFDGPQILPLIAPRPLLVINGDSDSLTPVPGLMEVVENTKTAYARANAADKFKFTLQPNTGHDVTPGAFREVIAWLEQWLQPSGRQ
jgi:dienelactone hydrolase